MSTTASPAEGVPVSTTSLGVVSVNGTTPSGPAAVIAPSQDARRPARSPPKFNTCTSPSARSSHTPGNAAGHSSVMPAGHAAASSKGSSFGGPSVSAGASDASAESASTEASAGASKPASMPVATTSATGTSSGAGMSRAAPSLDPASGDGSTRVLPQPASTATSETATHS